MPREGCSVTIAASASSSAAVTTAAAVAAAATTAAATAAAASTAASTTAAAAAGGTRSCFVDRHVPTGDRRAVEILDGFLRTVRVCHFDKRKTSRPSSFPIHDDVHRVDLAVGLESTTQVVIGR